VEKWGEKVSPHSFSATVDSLELMSFPFILLPDAPQTSNVFSVQFSSKAYLNSSAFFFFNCGIRAHMQRKWIFRARATSETHREKIQTTAHESQSCTTEKHYKELSGRDVLRPRAAFLQRERMCCRILKGTV